jgi:serine/threonine-protein kinase RsbW
MTRTPPRPALTGRSAYAQTLPRIPVSASHARQLVAHALHTWGLESLLERVEQCVAELVANAVQHSGSRSIRVTVSRSSDSRVRIAVTQRDCAPPLADRRPADEHGRGLILITALSSRWGSDSERHVFRCWCEFHLDPDRTSAPGLALSGVGRGSAEGGR